MSETKVDRFNFDELIKAQNKLREQYKGRQVGIGRRYDEENGHAIHLISQEEEENLEYPTTFEGFPVHVEIVSEVKLS